jgi:Uma2 family endonuclease
VDYDDAHPEAAHLLVEVAETSLRKDRGVKLGIYAENGVPEYWIVDVLGKRIEVHSDPDGARYRTLVTFGPGESIRLLASPDIEIRVDDLLR